jgi:hypothetical protein
MGRFARGIQPAVPGGILRFLSPELFVQDDLSRNGDLSAESLAPIGGRMGLQFVLASSRYGEMMHYLSRRKILENALVVVLLSLATMIVLDQANPISTTLGRDSGIYAYVASQLLHGKTPYVAAWESKPPGIFFIDAVALWLGRGTRWGIWGMEFLFLLGAAVAGFYALRRKFGFGPATLASLVWLSGLSLVLIGGNFTEEYALLFSFLWLLLFNFNADRTEPFYASLGLGVLFGAGFLTRPNNTGVQCSIILTQAIVALWGKHLTQTLRRLILIGVGFLLPIAAVSMYFVLKGAFQPFLEASLLYNISYVGGHLDLAGAFTAGIISLGFTAGVALVGIVSVMDEFQIQARSRKLDPFSLWLCLDFILEVVLSALSGRSYTHYFINWLPWMAFASGFLFNKAFPSIVKWSEQFSLPLLFVLIPLTGITYSSTLAVYGRDFAHLAARDSEVQRVEQVPQYVNDNTQPNETVLAWGGQAGINFLARRDAPTPYLFYPLLVQSKITDRFSAEYYRAIQSNPPVLIVDPSATISIGRIVPLSTPDPLKWTSSHGVYAPPYLEEFFAFFRQNYSYKTTIAGMAIYRLNR